MRTIAVVNQKGGCGKTTVSINLASALAELGKKTLLVDMDPQSHCAVGLAVPEEQVEQSIYDVLISKSRGEPIRVKEILWQINEHLELAPASIDLSAFEQQMVGIMERENCLKNILSEVKADYDFVIIDCPPAVGLLTFNALRTATDVIVPVETGYFALHGLSKQLETLSILCKRSSQNVNVRVLASMYDIRTKMAREILAELRTHFADKMFKTTVNFNTKIKEAASFGQPICEYDPASKGQVDFKALAEEVISLDGKSMRHEMVETLAGQLEQISTSADKLLKISKQQTPQPQQTPEPQIPQPQAPEPQISQLQTEEPQATRQQTPQPQTPEPQVLQPQTPEPQTLESQAPQLQTPDPAEPPVLPVEQVQPEPVSVPEPELSKAEPKSLDEKLSDYYGVNQMGDAVVFVSLYPHAKKVQIAGDFNSWQPGKTTMEKIGQSGIWQSKLNLTPGKYRYRLVVDGKWQQDPYNETTEINPFGEYNSIVKVK